MIPKLSKVIKINPKKCRIYKGFGDFITGSIPVISFIFCGLINAEKHSKIKGLRGFSTCLILTLKMLRLSTWVSKLKKGMPECCFKVDMWINCGR